MIATTVGGGQEDRDDQAEEKLATDRSVRTGEPTAEAAHSDPGQEMADRRAGRANQDSRHHEEDAEDRPLVEVEESGGDGHGCRPVDDEPTDPSGERSKFEIWTTRHDDNDK